MSRMTSFLLCSKIEVFFNLDKVNCYLCSSNDFVLRFNCNIKMLDLIPKEIWQGTFKGFGLNSQCNAKEDKCRSEHDFS